jgi:AcrR family transcriptional regulator
MKSDVNPSDPSPRRQYDSRRRKAAAAETRAAIVKAARRLFLERGYVGATMPAIADAAGVALDTVYAAVGAKPVLFRLLIELAISGEDEPVVAEERAYVRAIQVEPDPRRKLAAYARAIRMTQSRLAPLFVVLREAARGNPELAALWTEIAERRAANMRRLVAEVAAAAGGLRSGMTIEEAADLVWTTNGPEFYLLLVEERGWDPERFEQWLAELWIRMLLP